MIDKIANHYGLEAQSRQLQEECAELIVAVNKYHRNPSDKTKSNIVEEMADVTLMIRQIVLLLHCGGEVDATIDEKIDRQLKRIEEESNGRSN